MSYFVFFGDDYHTLGDVGFVGFDTEKKALDFINERVNLVDGPDPRSYRLIRGSEIKLETKERVTVIGKASN